MVGNIPGGLTVLGRGSGSICIFTIAASDGKEDWTASKTAHSSPILDPYSILIVPAR